MASETERMSRAIRLRPYQLQCIAALKDAFDRGRQAPILQLPTGGGKTHIFAEIIRRLAGYHPVLVLVHRRELIHQTSQKLTDAGVPHGIIAAGFTPSPRENVQVASIQTLAKRGIEGRPDLIVIDEAHHARADSWRRVLEAMRGAYILGCTATPARLDGKGLGVRFGGLFDDVVSGPSIGELITDGYLSPVRCFAPAQQIDTSAIRTRLGDYDVAQLSAAADVNAITGDAVEQYRNRADHQPAIAFCVSVDHGEHVAMAFREAGYRSACVHGKLPTQERDRLIKGLGTGEIEVLTSCELISEGLDVPSVGAVILLRPTKSLVLHMQQIGRGMRPSPGKAALIVNDHAGNIRRHGLPEHDRVWSLAGVDKAPGEAPVKRCPECHAIVPLSTMECPNCGYEWRRVRLRHERGDLAEINADAALIRIPYRQILHMRLTKKQLRIYAEAHGYKPGWVWYRMKAMEMQR
jgi:DNA repair protein RadD